MTDTDDTAVRQICYTDNRGRICGEPAVADLAIIPIGNAAADRFAPAAGHLTLCMKHLVALMYTNGVAPAELADVVDALSWHLARSIAAEEKPRGRARPILSATDDDPPHRKEQP